MIRLTWLVLIAPLFLSVSSIAAPKGSAPKLCEESLIGAARPVLRAFAKKVARAEFDSSPLTVMRYVDSVKIVSDLRNRKTRQDLFMVIVSYRYQNDPSVPVEKSHYEIVIDPDGTYTVQFLNMNRRLM